MRWGFGNDDGWRHRLGALCHLGLESLQWLCYRVAMVLGVTIKEIPPWLKASLGGVKKRKDTGGMGHGRLFGHVLWVCLLGVAVGLLAAWLMRWRLGAYCPTGRGMAGEWVRALFHWATPFAQRPNPPPDRPRHVAPSHQPCSQLPTATPSRLPTAHARCAYHAPCPLYLFFLPPIDALSHGGISFILPRS